ncbi:hypothetical protein K439DRAFT_206555 [Ramaria rubella]|nr:hypothetical protein K439DRAFT_206555 [Ramaria rubella]
MTGILESRDTTVAQATKYNLWNFNAVLACWTIVYYDHLLVLDREVDVVWSRLFKIRLSLSTVLYFIVRFSYSFSLLLNIDFDLRALQVT